MDMVDRVLKAEINLLYNLSKELATMDLHPEQLMRNVVRMLGDMEEVKRVALYIANADASEVSLLSGVGVEESNVKLTKKEGVVGFILREGYPVVIKDLAEEPLFLNKIKRENLREISFVGVPIKHEERIVGIITLDLKKGFTATSYLVDFLLMIANLIGSYLHTYIKVRERERVLQEEIATLRRELRKNLEVEGFVGVSRAYQSVLKQVYKVAGLDVTVMIRGESGTGKTTLAKAIHYLSPRKNNPFVEINCSAIPTELLEAELFGYEKGAFTGAYTTKMGKIEAANGGTLFFDEIGDLNPTLQAKLLRFMQTKEFERLGSTKTIRSDTRIIVATNKNLEEMVAKGDFREDLYYRVAIYPIYIPPLRERKEDIPVLVDHYLSQIGKAFGKKLKIKKEALSILVSCDFPGNVRELLSCLTRAAITSSTGLIGPEDLSCVGSGVCFTHMIRKIPQKEEVSQIEEVKEAELPRDEKERIIQALEKSGYVQAKAARMLGITVRQLNYRIKKYGIQIKKI
ncbi:MAG: sigma 54-interacting transcriptional regulator [Aquificaceae bacterium]|nr:sigma 54-interacting transcriptional regulator [Aquificaceae bacterium]